MTETSDRCPQCGAPARPDEADAFATCRFCGARLLLAAEPGVKHEIFLPALKPADLPSRLAKWLEEREAMGTPTDVASRLLFFPFWVHATRDQENLVPGAALLSDGLASFKLPAGDAKSFGPDFTRLGTVLPATVARESTPFGGAPASDLRLVHVPFFEISFRLFRKTVRVWMDAVSGQVLPLDPVPTSEAGLDRAWALLLAVLFGVAFAGFRSLFTGFEARGAILLLGAGPLLLLATRQVVVKMEES